MSKSYKEQGLEAKAIRVGIIDARPVSGKSKKKKIKDWYLLYCGRIWDRYETEAIRDKVFEKKKREWEQFGKSHTWSVSHANKIPLECE